MSSSESFYSILGVTDKASKEEIKKAYRTLSLKHHPDRTSNPESHQLFKKINEAYETLGDEQKRQEYDAMQRNPFMRMNSHFGGNSGGGMEIPVDEIFQAFFGGGSDSFFGDNSFPGFPGFPGFGSGGGPRSNIRIFTSGGGGHPFMNMNNLQKPTPIIKTIEITMDQVLTGANIPLVIERWIVENGNKTFENETLYIDIPKGIDDNEIIILRDKGNVLNQSIKGDVKLFIKVINNSSFIRNGLDLLFNKTISLKDALCGFTFELKYLNGKTYTLNCNQGNIVHPGYKKILPNMGLTREGHTGNLIIQFQVDFPEIITEKQIIALREIL
jgi:DnaJ-class molecular chaperone